jgi:serine/threonine protein kinase
METAEAKETALDTLDVLQNLAAMSSPIPPSTPGHIWQPPTPEELQSELPQYEIKGLLGRGGMGAVYKAQQKSLKREVAIKVLPPTLNDGGMRFAERFKAEAELMARLDHPGIIAVYDAGQTAGGLLYFVMAYVQGTDVAHMIAKSGKLPPEHAQAIAAHVCDALAYAHENGLIHRDIKPANIMVDTQGRVKVADFGLAKVANENNSFTQTHMAVGTPDFVAPEALIPGMPVDGRADLYAMGVMLYQMLTGEVPRGAWQPPSVRVPGVDRRFDDIVIKAMQTDREARYSSATELRQHLDNLLIPELPTPDLPRSARSGMTKPTQGNADIHNLNERRHPIRMVRHTQGSKDASPKSKTSLFIGIGAAAVVALVVFFMLGERQPHGNTGLQPANNMNAPPAVSSPSATPIKVLSHQDPFNVAKTTAPKPEMPKIPEPPPVDPNAFVAPVFRQSMNSPKTGLSCPRAFSIRPSRSP